MAMPSLSANQALILEILLALDGAYGLEICRASEGRLSRGGIYVTLQRMSDRGLVVTKDVIDPEAGGLPRRRYTVTGLGQATLKARRAGLATFGRLWPGVAT